MLTLRSSELRVGDVVLCNGMRVLLNREPTVYKREASLSQVIRYEHAGMTPPNADTVYSFSGLVLNPEEAMSTHRIPRGFIYDPADHYDEKARRWVAATEPRWTVQGNDLAQWGVERQA